MKNNNIKINIKETLDKEHGVEEYLYVLSKSDRLPNRYCVKSFLLGCPDLSYIEDTLGFRGFYSKKFKMYFIPPFMLKNNKPVFPSGVSVVEFPFAASEDNIRFDVEYILSREAVLYTAQKAPNLAKIFLNEYFIFSMPFGSEIEKRFMPQCIEFLKKYGETKDFVFKKFLKDVTPNFNELEWLFFKNYGQHRLILYFKNKVAGILIWDENHLYYTVLFVAGRPSTRNALKINLEQLKIMPCTPYDIEFPEALLFYEFCRRLPEKSLINIGGAGGNHKQGSTWGLMNAINTHEVKTCCSKHPFNYEVLTSKSYADDFQKLPLHRFSKISKYPEYMGLELGKIDPDICTSPEAKQTVLFKKNKKFKICARSFRDFSTPYKNLDYFPEYIYPVSYLIEHEKEITDRIGLKTKINERKIKDQYEKLIAESKRSDTGSGEGNRKSE